MRADSVSGVSSSRTGTAACSTIGPASSSAVTRCTVAPATFDAVLERLALRVDAGKRRQQRRVDVEDARSGNASSRRRADQPHEAGEADERDVARRSSLASAAIEVVAVGERPVIEDQRLDAGRARALEPGGIGAVRDDDGDARRRGVRRRSASMSAWRLLPRPEISTPIDGAARPDPAFTQYTTPVAPATIAPMRTRRGLAGRRPARRSTLGARVAARTRGSGRCPC